MSNKFTDSNGFTLIEILIALTIFSIGLLAIAGQQLTAISFNSGSNLRTSTTAVAQGVMEEVMSWPGNHDDFASDNTYNASIDPNDSDGDGDDTTLQLEGAGSYSASYTVDTGWQGITNLARIDVTVQETNGGRTITLTNFKRTY